MWIVRKIVLSCFVSWICANYQNDYLIRVYPQTGQDISLFLDENLPAEVDVWNEIHDEVDHIDLQCKGKDARKLREYLKNFGIRSEILSNNVQEMVEENLESQNLEMDRRDYTESGWNYTYYMPLEKINQWLDSKLKYCGSRCSKFSVGTSYEGRAMFALKISTGEGNRNKKAIWIDGGIHAREWISPASVMYVTDQLVHGYGQNTDVMELVNNFDWYILPVLNVDGYQYSWESNNTRLWRKTRKPVPGSSCIGTDANRNFDFSWNVTGTSGNPCSLIFPGVSPFSENVTKTLAKYLKSKPEGFFEVFLTIHSYGQYIMTPWGHTDESPNNYDELIEVGHIGREAALAVHGINYTVGQTGKVLYKNSGTSRDWAKGVLEIRWVYTFELRDKGEHGFLLPPVQLKPTAEEFWAAVKAMMKEVLKRRIPATVTGAGRSVTAEYTIILTILICFVCVAS